MAAQNSLDVHMLLYIWSKAVSKEMQEWYQTSEYWPVFAENGDEVKSQNEPGDNWAEELYDIWW